MGETEDKELTRARNAAYRLLTYRPRSRKELEDKLRDKEFPASIVASVIDHVTRLGYLNDATFARQWAESRVRHRGFGKRRIAQELKAKGIDLELIGETLKGLFEEATEADIARKEAEKKLKTMVRFEPEVRRRRLAGFLERKGFSFEVIRATIYDLVRSKH